GSTGATGAHGATVAVAPTATPGPPPVPPAARRAAAALPLDQLAGEVFLVGGDPHGASPHGWGGIVIDASDAPTPALVTVLAGEAAANAAAAGRPAPLIATTPAPAQPRTRAATDAAATALHAQGVTLVLDPVADVAVPA